MFCSPLFTWSVFSVYCKIGEEGCTLFDTFSKPRFCKANDLVMICYCYGIGERGSSVIFEYTSGIVDKNVEEGG